MTTTVSLRCDCGSFQGVAEQVFPAAGNHIVCYCDDCQAYLHHLGQPDLLDPYGGTEIFQLTPSQLKITSGREHLACLRLTEKGLLRWYANCCKTPFANTLASAKVPFAGMVTAIIKRDESPEALGPIIAKVNGKFATGKTPAETHARAPLGLIVRTIRILLVAKFKGQHTPSPFFNPATGKLTVEPKVISSPG